MRISISMKIFFSIIMMLVLAEIMGGFSIYSTLRASRDANDINERFIPVSIMNSNFIDEFLNLQRYIAVYMLSPNEDNYKFILESSKRVDEYATSIESIIKNDVRIQTLLPKTFESLNDYISSTKGYLKLATENVAMLRSSQAEERQFREQSEKIIALTEGFKGFYKNLITKEINAGDTGEALVTLLQIDRLSQVALNAMSARGAFAAGAFSNNMTLLKEADKYLKEMTTIINDMAKTAAMPETKEFTSNMQNEAKEMNRIMANVINTYGTLLNMATQRSAMATQSRELANSITANINTGMDQGATNSANTLEFGLKIIIIMSCLMIIGGLIMIIMMKMSVVNQINAFVGVVKNLTTGDGDLTRRIKAAHNDELADLAFNINLFIENVQQIVSDVKRSADDVASGNNQLAATMEELSMTFNTQTEQVSGMVGDMEKIQESATNAAVQLNECLDVMNTTSDETVEGARKLSEVMQSVRNIHNQTASLSETIKQLSESSSQIGEILTVINDIADQTNLLALNAAIEAARAGDAGRGFAVVADEVRKLAERTQKATSEIEQIISNLQSESEQASNEMTIAGKTVSDGVVVIESTSASFSKVVNGVDSATGNTKTVVMAVDAQNEVITSVGDKTQIIASGIEESNAAVAEVALTVTHLQERAEHLKNLVGRFQV